MNLSKLTQHSKVCPECGRKPKRLTVEAGKYGGIITVVLIACQVLGQVLNTP